MNDGRVKTLGVRYYGELAQGRNDMIVNSVLVGLFRPMLEAGIGMAYVPVARAKADTELTIDVRGKPRAARVVKKPIYKRED